ncbi:MAG: TadG family pilus assembly protein [Acidimicrobiia bacterium]
MRELIRTAWKRDRGAALAIVATSLFLLMGVAAISADLAWYYLNASRVQRAADAAALAGVVHLPQQPGEADNTALDIANRNGYEHGDLASNTVVTPEDISPNQLRVHISTDVDTFFAKVLGWDTMTIARSAVAEFIPPLKLGSPENQFGNDCSPAQPGCSGQPNFWANIHGHFTDTRMGDAFSSQCAPGPPQPNDNPGCNSNNWSRDYGYLYGIESPVAFTVEFNDLEFRNTSDGTACPGNNQGNAPFPDGCTSDWTRTGDRGCEAWGVANSPDCGPTMYVALYAPDPTPLDISDNTLLCEATIPPRPQVPESDPYIWQTPAAIPGAISGPTGSACWTRSGPGIHVLQVKVVDPLGATNRAGLNRYSVRALPGGITGAKLFAIGDFALYNNVGGSITRFYLAEVPAFYNGKTFVVELWDAGDAPGGGSLAVVDPSLQVFDDGECRISRRPNLDADWSPISTIPAGSPCQKSIASQEHNGEWIKYEMDIPATYSCSDCWWRMQYNYPGGVNDTTTWRAYMIGNPIHIID